MLKQLLLGSILLLSTANHFAEKIEFGGIEMVFEGVKAPSTQKEKRFLYNRLLKYANASELAYEDDEDILAKYPNAEIGLLEDTNVKFFLVKDHKKKSQFLAFRGTDGFTNILIDATFWPKTDETLGVNVHKGFYKVAREFFKEGIKTLDPNYSITITGHSLGAAVAALVGMKLQKSGYNVHEVVTFGQPRFTDLEGANYINQLPVIRIGEIRDLVTFLPPLWITSFKHFGDKLEFRGADGYIFKNNDKNNQIDKYQIIKYSNVRKFLTAKMFDREKYILIDVYLFSRI